MNILTGFRSEFTHATNMVAKFEKKILEYRKYAVIYKNKKSREDKVVKIMHVVL